MMTARPAGRQEKRQKCIPKKCFRCGRTNFKSWGGLTRDENSYCLAWKARVAEWKAEAEYERWLRRQKAKQRKRDDATADDEDEEA